MHSTDVQMGALVRRLVRYRVRADKELDLQDAVAQVLRHGGFAFDREARLAEGDVADFLVAPGICVEVKMKGGVSALTRQLHRYAQHETVRGLLVVASRRTLVAGLPESLSGKPVGAVVLGGFWA